MNIRLTVLLSLLSPLFPLTSAFGQTDQEPPTAFIVGEPTARTPFGVSQ